MLTVVLDTGVLGLVAHPKRSLAVSDWVGELEEAGAVFVVPVVATTNIRHLALFVDARSWSDIRA